MTFPASQQTLEDALANVRHTAMKIRAHVLSVRTNSATNSLPRTAFVDVQKRVQDAIDRWDEAATVQGLAQYAQTQYSNNNLDIVLEYQQMRAAAISLRDWVFNNIPTSASGAAELQTPTQSGELQDILVTPAQSAGFRTQADAFIATIG